MPTRTMQSLTLWHFNGDEPTPPATAKAMPTPKPVIDLGAALKRAYSKDARRIA